MVAALGTAVLLAACGDGGAAGSSRLAVYAASSLTEAFGELETVFEASHPGTDVAVTFAGSQVLRIQIEEGAPADVFASANPEHMEALVREGLVADARVFARNELVVIVPTDDPAGIESFADLPRATRVVLGTADVPVGRYAREALAAADGRVRPGFAAEVLGHVVSEESNVRLARSKVELGEADAAIVYRTDAARSDRVRTITIPAEVNVRAEYLVGAVSGAAGAELARAWIDLVLSPEGQAVLARYGFMPA